MRSIPPRSVRTEQMVIENTGSFYPEAFPLQLTSRFHGMDRGDTDSQNVCCIPFRKIQIVRDHKDRDAVLAIQTIDRSIHIC